MQDEKVVDNTVDNFNRAFPHGNKFIVILPQGRESPKYASVKDGVYFVHYASTEFWSIIGDMEEYSHVFLHSFWKEIDSFVAVINHKNIYWFVWGADLYELLEIRNYQLYANPKKAEKFRARGLPGWLFRWLLKYKNRHVYARAKLLGKIRYLVTEFEEEFELLKTFFPEIKHLERKAFFYYPIDSLLSEKLLNSKCDGLNCFVGNSSSLHSNHEAIFQVLEDIDLSSKKLFTPLSYGDTRYADYISNLGERLLPNNFVPLRSFVPLEEYYNQFLSASFFIYGNYRQCAVGNIVMAIYFGGKLFLYECNPLFKFFKSLGIVIFSLNSISQEDLDTPLAIEDKERNRQIILERYNSQAQHLLIKEI